MLRKILQLAKELEAAKERLIERETELDAREAAVSLDMEEHPRDWRGYFMASVLVMEAIKGTE